MMWQEHVLIRTRDGTPFTQLATHSVGHVDDTGARRLLRGERDDALVEVKVGPTKSSDLAREKGMVRRQQGGMVDVNIAGTVQFGEDIFHLLCCRDC
jgi:hypothetical protein